MKKIALALCTAFAFALPAAQAQTAAPAQATAAIDPAATAAVKELLASMKYREMMQASFAQLQKNMPQIMQQGATAAINGNASLTPEQKKQALEKAAREIPAAAAAFNDTFNDPKLMDELVAEIIPLYARHFTPAEIGQIAAFYKTPVGQKMMSTMPAVMNESMQIGQRVMMPRIGAAIDKISKAK